MKVTAKAAKAAKAAKQVPDFRVCPQCETRNKAKWEFCARCGESMQDVPLGLPAGAVLDTGDDAVTAAGGPGAALGIAAVLLAGAGAVWVVARHRPEPETVNPGIFTMATTPAALPKAEVVEDDEAGKLFVRGRSLLARRDAVTAAPLLEQAYSMKPDRVDYRHWYAKALWQSGNRERALVEFSAVAAALDSAIVWVEYGKNLDVSGRTADAIEAYDKALGPDPNNAEVLRLLASAHTRLNQHDKALVALTKLAEVNPDDPVVGQDLGMALDKSGDLDGAAAAFRRVLERVPSATITRGLLAEVLFKQGKRDEAVAVFRQGLEREPQTPLLHRGLGSLLERTGQPAEAAAAYRSYAKLAPEAPDAKQLEDRAARLEQGGPRS